MTCNATHRATKTTWMHRTALPVVCALSVALVACSSSDAGGSDGNGVSSMSISVATATSNDIQDALLREFAAELESRSDGQMTVEVFNGSALGDNNSLLQQLQAGTLAASSMPSSFLTPFVEQYGVLELPFLFDDYEHQKEVAASAEMSYFVDAAAEKDLRVAFHYPYSPDFKGLVTTFEVGSIDDLQGRTMRSLPSPELIGQFESWGASAVPMGIAELYTALEQGTVEGLENPLSIYEASSLYEVAPYFTRVDHGALTNVFVISAPWFDSLSEAEQTVVDEAADAVNARVEETGEELFESASQVLTEDGGVTITELPEEERQRFRDAVTPVWEEALSNPVTAEALEALEGVVDLSPGR